MIFHVGKTYQRKHFDDWRDELPLKLVFVRGKWLYFDTGFWDTLKTYTKSDAEILLKEKEEPRDIHS